MAVQAQTLERYKAEAEGYEERLDCEVIQMKHGKNPTREQKKIIADNGLNVDNWYVSKVFPDRLELIHKQTDRMRVVKVFK